MSKTGRRGQILSFVLNEAAAAHGGQADVNPMENNGFMYTRDLADPDGHMWAALWMDPEAMPAAAG
jgi:predicted lactoylglutathione lyase